MRPVNLIPPEERRGEAAPTRTGSLSYVIVGVLAVAVLAVTAVVLTNKSVAKKESEVAVLEQQASEAEARAASLASFTQFQSLHDARVETVAQLATSRFDWDRVMRELATVMPENVWLVNLTGKASPEVKVPEEANVAFRDTVPGYALELVGCARSQRDVASLITSMEDIDGVTRVTATRSEKPKDKIQITAADDQVREDCRTRDFVTQFELVAAMDNPSPPRGAGGAPASPDGSVVPPPAAGGGPAPTTEGGVGDVQQARTDGAESVASAEGDAENAASVVPGGGN